jgi:hypothetical protein
MTARTDGHGEQEPLYLLMSTADGESHVEEVTWANGTIRVAVGDHAHRSSVLRIWANKNSADVYVSVRVLTGVMKFSLHESGECHYGFVSSEVAQTHTDHTKRFLDVWQRPADVNGWTRALTFWVPHGQLSETPDEPPDDGVLWLPEPESGLRASIHVALMKPGANWTKFVGAAPVAAFKLSNGEAVVVLYGQDVMTTAHRESLTEALSRARITAEQVKSIAEAEAPRKGVFGNDDTGARNMWDLKLSRSAIKPIASGD